MQIINAVIMIGVAVLAVALVTFAVGKTFTGMVALNMAADGSTAGLRWWETMDNITTNSQTAFGLVAISPLVLGVGVIISILIGAFAYMYVRE